MKSVISGLLVAFSMYSAIPVPQVNWEKQTMRWALGFLPLIGVLIGVIELFWFEFCVYFGAAGVFYAVIAALIPLAVSGGIHHPLRRDPPGRVLRHLRRAVLVRRPGKAAGHPQGPARWRIRAALADGIPAGRGRVFCPDLRPACASSAGMHRICFRTGNGRPQGGCVTVRKRQRTCTYLCGKQR